ncbi:MAG: hypothetical protein PHS37_06935, partial [Candidatus Omnitrophica bacterium]|nr:hypothetical protein [Candidatus Omnitrophota bacterium]
ILYKSMRLFVGLKPNRAKIVLFLILCVVLCVLPIVKGNSSIFGPHWVPPVALYVGRLIDIVETETSSTFGVVFGYFGSLVSAFFFIYVAACVMVEGYNRSGLKRRGR